MEKLMTQDEKIAIITPSLNGGGAEKVAVNLANYYVSVGYSVDLVVFKLTGPYQILLSDKVHVVDLKVPRTRYVFWKLRQYFKKNQNTTFLSVLRNANILVGLAALGLNLRRLVFREANTLNELTSFKQPKKFLHRLLMKLAYSRADHIIANSEDTKFDLCQQGIINESKATVIRNPVLAANYRKLKQNEIEEPWLTVRETKVILSVGRLQPQKNFPFLISVFSEVYQIDKSARLLIVGEGNERQRLIEQIKRLGLVDVVKLVEFQTNIYPYYEGADVFALSSDWEGFGNVLVEALSVGLPIVSTNCPGGPKMILKDGKYGTLVPLGDKRSYAQALLRSLENPTKSQDSIDYAKRFTVENVAKEYFEIMK